MGLLEDTSATLECAFKTALNVINPPCNHKEFIDFVIDNTHLTYKYILFTAVLSKAADESINPLCLQKGSKLPGSYDARTICHKVVVPFDMNCLNKALGGSNEPFLNKPARYPELDKGNAVRKGRDKDILNAMCDNLPLIVTSEDAYQCLVYMLHKLLLIKSKKERLSVIAIDDSKDLPIKLTQYINEALAVNYGGEVLTLMVAGVFHLLYLNDKDVAVEVHPVNQSGASKREISDLDIYSSGILISSNEMKDKEYGETDVRHAADKVKQAGGTSMLFIEGPRGEHNGDFIDLIQDEYTSNNFMLRVVPYQSFLSVMIPSLDHIDCEEFVRFVLDAAQNNKFKDVTISYLKNLAQRIFGV